MKLTPMILAAAAMLGASSAVAQQESSLGSRITRPEPAEPDYRSKLPEAEQARALVDEFAQCTLDYSPTAVDEALEFIPGTSESSAALAKLARPRCLSNATLRMPSDLLRGALFRAKVLNEFVDQPLVFASEPIDLTQMITDSGNKDQLRFLILQDFGSCVVRSNPEVAAAFIVELAGSEKEQEALDQLVPLLGPCLPEGSELAFSKSMLSAQLAEALYRDLSAVKTIENSDA